MNKWASLMSLHILNAAGGTQSSISLWVEQMAHNLHYLLLLMLTHLLLYLIVLLLLLLFQQIGLMSVVFNLSF